MGRKVFPSFLFSGRVRGDLYVDQYGLSWGMLCVLGKKVYSVAGAEGVLQKSIMSVWLAILFKSSLSPLIFFLLVLSSSSERGVL